MLLKKFLLVIFILNSCYSNAQKIIFKDNFENKQIDSATWQNVTGNWRIGDVQELRIAPAEKGFQHVLLSGGEENNIIRLLLDLPDSLRGKKIKLSFSYYILSKVAGTKIEVEFYQKEIKDGLRGRLWVDFLHRKPGRWSVYQNTLTVPAGANSVRIVFFALKLSSIKDMKICFDNIVVSAVK